MYISEAYREKAKESFLDLMIQKKHNCSVVAAMAHNRGYNLGASGIAIVSQYNVSIRKGTYLSFGARLSKKEDGGCRQNLLRFLLSVASDNQSTLIARTSPPVTSKAFGDLIFTRMLEDLKDFDSQKKKELHSLVDSWMRSVKCNLVEEALVRNGYTTEQIKDLLSEKIH